MFVLFISGYIFCFGIIIFDTHLSNSLIELDPSFVQMLVEVGIIAWKIITLKAEIDLFLLVATFHSALFVMLADFVPASCAVALCKIIEHEFEIWIFLKDGIIEKRLKSFRIDIKVSESFFKLQAVLSDITIDMCETFFTAQSARTQCIEYMIVCHILPFDSNRESSVVINRCFRNSFPAIEGNSPLQVP